MTLTVRLAGWEAKGLRCPDHKVSFETTAGSTHPISLIQMPNGTGKTTTLTLLRATLSGSPPSGAEWSPDLIQEFRKNADTESGSFQVSLLHNQKRITIALHFDFEQLEVRYSTTNRRGNEPGFHPPRGLDRFLNAYFANFFVFDGELAESLLDRSKTDAEEVIDKLFQLTHFDGMSGWADSYWKERTAAKAKAANTSSSTLKGLTQWRGRVDRYTGRLKYLQDEQQRLVTEQRSLRRRLKKLQAESEAAMKAKADIGKEITEAEGSLKLAEAEVRRQTDALLHRFRSPHAISADFASSMLDFKEALDRVKLPESAARDFFEELAKEETCVCGRPLDPLSRQAILDGSASYLGSDDMLLLNHIKSDVGDHVGGIPACHEQSLRTDVARLEESLEAEGIARTKRDAVKSKAVHQDPALEQKERKIGELLAQISVISSELERFDDPRETAEVEDTWGIKVVKRQLEQAKCTYSQIGETLDLKSKCETLCEIFREARDKAKTIIGETVVREANERIEQLMPSNKIRIETIDKCLRLSGGKLGGSAGETLAVAYAFLSMLFDRDEHRLPFIVDYPAGPLDHPKRAAVAALIPRLTGQFIAFLISTEREGFQDRLQAAAREPIQYITLFRRGDATLESGLGRGTNAERTSDGILVHGRKYFENFQLESEP